jgi:hypothetical protein
MARRRRNVQRIRLPPWEAEANMQQLSRGPAQLVISSRRTGFESKPEILDWCQQHYVRGFPAMNEAIMSLQLVLVRLEAGLELL